MIYGLLLVGFVSPSYGDATGSDLPGQRDRCPVCGMFVKPYPEWQATMVFSDGTRLFFDGPKDLLRYYFNLPDKNRNKTRQKIRVLYATDYYTTELKPVTELYFVIGSDVYGPMGEELVPISGLEPAQTFQRDHQGRQILRFEQLTPQILPAD